MEMLLAAKNARRSVQALGPQGSSRVLLKLASALRSNADAILAANAVDLERMSPDDPRYDRLKLTDSRLDQIASDVENVASLPSPLGEELSRCVRPNGMVIRKISVPFGVIGVIYEARPNVTSDVFSLCLRSGNVAVLKGGSDALCSNEAIASVIRSTLESEGVDPAACTLLPASHEASDALLGAVGIVDLIIPRGSSRLINYVRDNARVPVIETGAGICHTYFDKDGDLQKGSLVVNNAKTRRVSVCNALDCLVIHSSRLGDLPAICSELSRSKVRIYADPRAYAALDGHYPQDLLERAGEDAFGTEFLDYKMSIKTVDTLQQALEHIERHSSKHSECIICENPETVRVFQETVDASCVYANVSTAFTDGGQFGFGAEIGISTQKLHARGPMALRELTTYKYLINGEGQIRRP